MSPQRVRAQLNAAELCPNAVSSIKKITITSSLEIKSLLLYFDQVEYYCNYM